jgi:hypothetical protein
LHDNVLIYNEAIDELQPFFPFAANDAKAYIAQKKEEKEQRKENARQ